MISTTNRDRCRLIAGRVTSECARDKVARALYEAAIEGMEFGPRDLPGAEDREWIRGALALPLQEATDAALEVLVWAMAQVLERAPNDLLTRFERSHHLEELGFE
jgi:hypothetical protein